MKIFLFEFYGSINSNKKIFIEFDQVVAKITSLKVKIFISNFIYSKAGFIWGGSIEKGQIIFSKIFLIFKLKYLDNYLIKFAKKFFILILKLYRIKIKKILLNLLR